MNFVLTASLGIGIASLMVVSLMLNLLLLYRSINSRTEKLDTLTLLAILTNSMVMCWLLGAIRLLP